MTLCRGYMAPEYAIRGQLTEKADVFSFGVLLLEIISGRKNKSLPQHMEFLIEAVCIAHVDFIFKVEIFYNSIEL
jgi:hypothetical protein